MKRSNTGKKIGIDTSVIINLIIKDIDIYDFKKNNFSENDKLYYTIQTKKEFRGVILNRYGFDKKEKDKLWKRAKRSLGLIPIRIGKRDISKYLDKVNTINNSLSKNINLSKFQMNYKVGIADIRIIANFLKWNITKVYTSDRAFYETCNALGIESKFISSKDYSLMKRR